MYTFGLLQPLSVQAINAARIFCARANIFKLRTERTNGAILDDSAGLPGIYNLAVRISSIKGLCVQDNTFNLAGFRIHTHTHLSIETLGKKSSNAFLHVSLYWPIFSFYLDEHLVCSCAFFLFGSSFDIPFVLV